MNGEFSSLVSPELVLVWGSWEMRSDWVFTWRNQAYIVPVGMDTDGASIPQFALSIMGGRMSPVIFRAALAHDFLYWSGDVPRLEADSMFREALRVNGAGFLRRWVMFLAVYLFGWVVWCRHEGRRWCFSGPACPETRGHLEIGKVDV